MVTNEDVKILVILFGFHEKYSVVIKNSGHSEIINSEQHNLERTLRRPINNLYLFYGIYILENGNYLLSIRGFDNYGFGSPNAEITNIGITSEADWNWIGFYIPIILVYVRLQKRLC